MLALSGFSLCKILPIGRFSLFNILALKEEAGQRGEDEVEGPRPPVHLLVLGLHASQVPEPAAP
ncbi:MAG: hypothetical protein ACRDIF_06775, partial [Actinomycetota bacterium]